jgi:hypothetical protein
MINGMDKGNVTHTQANLKIKNNVSRALAYKKYPKIIYSYK